MDEAKENPAPSEAAQGKAPSGLMKYAKYIIIAVVVLVILGLVLTASLVGIALMGFFPSTAQDARIAQSDSYWRGEAMPFAILSHSVSSSGTATLSIQSLNAAGAMTITELKVGSATYTTPMELAPGEIKQVSISGVQPGSTGSSYDLPVEIAYTSPNGVPANQHGAKNLVGKYS